MNDSEEKRKLPFVMVRIPSGAFLMGTKFGHGEDDERPEHQVHVDEFFIARYPVTATEWAIFLNDFGNPDNTNFEPSDETTVVLVNDNYYPRKDCSRHPANGVNYPGAETYCQWLSEKSGKAFRLPTEAEWEKAARGGREGMRFPWGNDSPNGLAQYNQTWSNPGHTLSPVDAYPPNVYSLHDCVGNVWEWCSDWYDGEYYATSPTINPKGPESGQLKVMRGGSWGCLDIQIRCGIRVGEWLEPDSSAAGFRVARSS